MTFPTIPTGSRILTANQLNSTATRTFPDLSGLTKNAGDLLIAIIVAYQSSTTNAQFSGWTAGWTEFVDTGVGTGSLSIGAAYKWSTGSETGTISVTQAATITGDAAMTVMSIAGAHATTPPEAGARVDGTGTVSDPAAFNPTGWDVEDTLWIAVHGNGMTAATSTWTGTGSTAPTNYSDLSRLVATDTSTIGDVEMAVAFRHNAVASEDAGGFSGTDQSNARNSTLVIAVRPATAVPPIPEGQFIVNRAALVRSHFW